MYLKRTVCPIKWHLVVRLQIPHPVSRKCENKEKCERPLFRVSVISARGYCRNMAMQHGRLRGRGPAPSVDIKGVFSPSVLASQG